MRSKLQDIIEKLAAKRNIPHVLLEVKSGDGEFHWKGAAGRSGVDGIPIQPDTPWFIASINKTMIAAMILRLQEQGLVNIDDRLVDHLPMELVHGLHKLDGTDHTAKITLRHLLGHGSGLPDWLEDKTRNGVRLVDRLVAGSDREYPLIELMDLVRDMKPYFPPRSVADGGVKIRYSDTNYLLLEQVIATVTGEGSEKAYRDLLFEPLGMDHTWLTGLSGPRQQTLPAAVLYSGADPLPLPLFLKSIHSVYSTGWDMILFLQGLLTGKLFKEPRTLQLMIGTWNRFGLPTNMASLRAPGWPIEYGLGIKRFQFPHWISPFQRTPAVIGHTGSTGSWLFHCHELDMYIAGTVDQVTAGAVPYRLVPQLLQVLKKA